MSDYSTNEWKSGLKVLWDGEPCSIIENEFIKPGKGQAFNRVKFRQLKTGRVLEKTFKSGDTLPGADVLETEMQFLYADGSFWHFMHPETFEQYSADARVVGDAKLWLVEQNYCTVTLYNDAPLLIQPPHFVHLEVTATDPGVRGDTASGGNKAATVSTGAVVRVPLFLNTGDWIRIDTRTGVYVSRVKT